MATVKAKSNIESDVLKKIKLVAVAYSLPDFDPPYIVKLNESGGSMGIDNRAGISMKSRIRKRGRRPSKKMNNSSLWSFR